MRQQIFNPYFFLYNRNSAEQINKIFQANQVSTINYTYLSKGTLYMFPRKSIKESTLETEGPLPEKDEVKKAEQRTMEQQKKIDKKQPKKSK